MKCVRLPLLSRDFLLGHVDAESLVRHHPDCKDLLIEALKFHLLPEQRGVLGTSRTRPRRCEGAGPVLFAVGRASRIPLTLCTASLYVCPLPAPPHFLHTLYTLFPAPPRFQPSLPAAPKFPLTSISPHFLHTSLPVHPHFLCHSSPHSLPKPPRPCSHPASNHFLYHPSSLFTSCSSLSSCTHPWILALTLLLPVPFHPHFLYPTSPVPTPLTLASAPSHFLHSCTAYARLPVPPGPLTLLLAVVLLLPLLPQVEAACLPSTGTVKPMIRALTAGTWWPPCPLAGHGWAWQLWETVSTQWAGKRQHRGVPGQGRVCPLASPDPVDALAVTTAPRTWPPSSPMTPWPTPGSLRCLWARGAAAWGWPPCTGSCTRPAATTGPPASTGRSGVGAGILG